MSCKKTKLASRSHAHLRNHNVQQNLNQYRDSYPSALIFLWEVCLTNPVLVSCLSFFRFYRVSFFFGGWGSLTHPMLASFLSWEFLLHIPCWFHICLGSFLTHPILAFLFCGEFLLHFQCFFVFVLFLFIFFVFVLSGEFLLDIPYWFLSFFFFFFLNRCSFPYTSHAGFIFIWGVSLTHPVWLNSYLGRFF